MDTAFPKFIPNERGWFVLDAAGKPVGRVALAAAKILSGKGKPTWSPHMDCGDHVIVINAGKVIVTGKKSTQKIYYDHSGYPGGLRETPFYRMKASMPERVIERAIKGMLPRGPLGRAMYRKLKVYRDSEHPHIAQTPSVVSL